MDNIIDLSVPIDSDFWEPEKVTREIVDHKAGANKLGESYLYFHTSSWWKRVFVKLFKRKKWIIDHNDFPDGMGLSLMYYRLTTHTGTHIDAPYHYGWHKGQEQPATITDIPLDWFYSHGVLLDFSQNDQLIDKQAVENQLKEINYKIKENDIVLISTGADKLIGSKSYFTHYRAIESSAVQWLVEQGVKIIGTDAFSFDRPFIEMINDYKKTGNKACLWPSHFIGRDHPYLQIERLCNLNSIPKPYGFKVCCFPIKLEKADASWSRVVAIFDNNI
ncbi:cyclase family protein [Photorhabdus tasmaniensis]|uniref:cyclase family protein n=1 Tax=Photorhabdus tasmaniensis TaxID=1004159 RepID=UPI0040423F5B